MTDTHDSGTSLWRPHSKKKKKKKKKGKQKQKFCRSGLRSCVKVEVAVLGSPSLIVRTVSGDVKQH